MVQSPFKDCLSANALFKIMVGCPDVFISLLVSIQTFFCRVPLRMSTIYLGVGQRITDRLLGRLMQKPLFVLRRSREF